MINNLPTKQLTKFCIYLLLVIVIAHTFISQANFYTLAVSIQVNNPEAQDGDIVSLVNGEYVLSSSEYDNLMFGILTDDPNLSIEDVDLENSHLLITEGEVSARVSTIAGEIKKGDYLTSSSIPGVAQKADKTGQILGVALEDYSAQNSDEVGKIRIILDIKSAFIGNTNVRGNLLQTLKSGISAPFLTPVDSLRYLLSAIIVGATFLLGFASFSRISGNSLHALGRNPLASKEIRTALIFNFILTFLVMVVGFGISYLMLIY